MDNLRDQWIILACWFTAPERVAGSEIIQWIGSALNGSEVARCFFVSLFPARMNWITLGADGLRAMDMWLNNFICLEHG